MNYINAYSNALSYLCFDFVDCSSTVLIGTLQSSATRDLLLQKWPTGPLAMMLAT